jgi:sec-independent protein translocase protein TatC
MTTRDSSELKGGSKTFLEHLDDLRKMLLACLLFAGIGICVAVPLSPWILEAIKRPLAAAGRNPGEFLKVMDMTGGIVIGMRISLWGGLLIASPFMAWAIAWFVFPGLSRKEKRVAVGALLFSVLLFVSGAAMCYFMSLPLAMRFMFRINELMGVDCAFVNVADYAAFVLMLMLAFGLSFQFPIVILALGSLGLVNSRLLRDKRRHAIVAIFIISMILTPPDVASQILMAVPLMGLYELCVWILRAKEGGAAEKSLP